MLSIQQFEALLDRKFENNNRLQYNAGIIAAEIWNTAAGGDPKRRPKGPVEFVPEWDKRVKASERARKQSVAEQISVLTDIFGVGPDKPVADRKVRRERK